MATDLKTITFADGETYYVNDRPVQVSGTLEADAELIDFGTFDPGLTEVEVNLDGTGATDAAGTYFYLVINGTTTGFMTLATIYTFFTNFRFKKVGGVWYLNAKNSENTNLCTIEKNAAQALVGADAITSLAVKAYAGTPFKAGFKYGMEGR